MIWLRIGADGAVADGPLDQSPAELGDGERAVPAPIGWPELGDSDHHDLAGRANRLVAALRAYASLIGSMPSVDGFETQGMAALLNMAADDAERVEHGLALAAVEALAKAA